MAKKLMQDIQSKGVRITRIARGISDGSLVSKEVKSTFEEVFEETQADNLSIELKKKQSKIPEPALNSYTRESSQKMSRTPRVKNDSHSPRTSLRILLILTILGTGIFLVSNTFENIYISIIEKHSSLTAAKEQFTAESGMSTPMHFELMIVSDTQSKEMILTESQNVSLRAHGKITLFNIFSTKPQNLRVHTMLSDEKGRIYQTDTAVTIPGFTTDKVTNVVTPGQIVVGISSYFAGEAYNGSPSDFVITKLKNTPKDKKIYGKLVSPLTGGAQGVVYVPSPQNAGMLTADALSSFKSNLIKKVYAQVPSGYILYPNAFIFSYTVPDTIMSPIPNTKIDINGTVSAIILKEKDVSDALIKKLLPTTSEKELQEIQIPDIAKLVFTFTDPHQSITKDMNAVNFTLTGTINPVWRQDVEMLKKSLVSMSKVNLSSLFASDPGIISASIKIFPPWAKYLPNDSSKIHIKIE